MDETELSRQTRRVAAMLAERLPPEDVAPVWKAVRSGDNQRAASSLVTALIRRDVALSTEQRRVLGELLRGLGKSTLVLSKLPEELTAEPVDFHSLVSEFHEVVDRLASNLEPKWERIITDADRAGSWKFALTELAAILAAEQIAVSAVDRHRLTALLSSMGASTEDADRISMPS
jgi:hypothetical protein